tara:strand:+ start:278 stop:403 length:126 start_codon:yes stop_codon:yes gene_type:complete
MNGISVDENGGNSIFIPQTPPPNSIRTVVKDNFSYVNINKR